MPATVIIVPGNGARPSCAPFDLRARLPHPAAVRARSPRVVTRTAACRVHAGEDVQLVRLAARQPPESGGAARLLRPPRAAMRCLSPAAARPLPCQTLQPLGLRVEAPVSPGGGWPCAVRALCAAPRDRSARRLDRSPACCTTCPTRSRRPPRPPRPLPAAAARLPRRCGQSVASRRRGRRALRPPSAQAPSGRG
jgi:hypothetical protein